MNGSLGEILACVHGFSKCPKRGVFTFYLCLHGAVVKRLILVFLRFEVQIREATSFNFFHFFAATWGTFLQKSQFFTQKICFVSEIFTKKTTTAPFTLGKRRFWISRQNFIDDVLGTSVVVKG